MPVGAVLQRRTLGREPNSRAGRPPGYAPHPSETDPGVLALVGHWLEDDLDRHIRGVALALGYWPYHTRLSLRSEGGFPDWLLLRPQRLVVVEAKRQGLWPSPARQSKRGKWSIAQAEWLYRWSQRPATEVYLWWPSDSFGDIARILQHGPDAGMASVRRTRAVLGAVEGWPDDADGGGAEAPAGGDAPAPAGAAGGGAAPG